MLRFFRVTGDSMRPTLDDGDYVLALTSYCPACLHRLLVVNHPEYGVIIKRAISVEADGSCWLSSENAAGVNTQQLGLIIPEQILGWVIWRIRR